MYHSIVHRSLMSYPIYQNNKNPDYQSDFKSDHFNQNLLTTQSEIISSLYTTYDYSLQMMIKQQSQFMDNMYTIHDQFINKL